MKSKWKLFFPCYFAFFVNGAMVLLVGAILPYLIEEAGISLKNANGKINVGPMSARADTTTIGPNQSVNGDEIAAFDWLTQHGHLVEFRLVPDASCYSWQDARQKLK